MYAMEFAMSKCKSNFFLPAFPILILYFIFSPSIFAQTKTTTYTYDALGRLTFVTDPANGNRDYDYDKAGNRLLVSANSANDAATEPEVGVPLPAPVILPNQGCFQVAPGAYRGTWSAVTGAARYLYRTQNGNEYLVNGLQSEVYTSSCDWVRACSSTSIQSCNGIKADF